MSSPALTQSDFGDKFAAIQSRITPAALDLINRSETLKAAIRRYENDGRTRAVDLDDDTTPNAATYQPPGEGDGTDGYITFGVDTLRNSIDIVHVLSHELGHHAVEGLGDLITNARNSAYAKGDFEGLEKSCHLSEGYALLKSAKVAEEIVNSGVTGSDARKLTAWWESERYAAYKDSAASLSWTRDAMDASLAYLLGDHNRWKTTSNTKESYLQ